ncbi:GNAT family N-acetyltransferase [soil metagenome]
MRVSQATTDDAGAIASVHIASWREAYRDLIDAAVLDSMNLEERTARWKRTFEHGRTSVLVVRVEDSVVGFVAFGPSRDADAPSGSTEVYALYLLPNVWSQGYGAQLWDAVVHAAREQAGAMITVWVLVGNERASRFYERMGCKADGAEKQEETLGVVLRENRYLLAL